jgi:hypothetical protein
MFIIVSQGPLTPFLSQMNPVNASYIYLKFILILSFSLQGSRLVIWSYKAINVQVRVQLWIWDIAPCSVVKVEGRFRGVPHQGGDIMHFTILSLPTS